MREKITSPCWSQLCMAGCGPTHTGSVDWVPRSPCLLLDGARRHLRARTEGAEDRWADGRGRMGSSHHWVEGQVLPPEAEVSSGRGVGG